MFNENNEELVFESEKETNFEELLIDTNKEFDFSLDENKKLANRATKPKKLTKKQRKTHTKIVKTSRRKNRH